MACDLFVALGRATVNGHTFVGMNFNRPDPNLPCVVQAPGSDHAPDEMVRTTHVQLSPAKHHHASLGLHSGRCNGYRFGVNDQGLAVGCTYQAHKLEQATPALLGTEAVRLILERCSSASQAVDLLASYVERHGIGEPGESPEHDDAGNMFLLADRNEAFLVATFGNHWVWQAVHQVSHVPDACVMGQSWNRISRNLANQAIEKGWWQADGSKLDVAQAVSLHREADADGLRRWGRATMMLEQQAGSIDVFFGRALLEHVELLSESEPGYTCAGVLIDIARDPAEPSVFWYSPGLPSLSVHLPLLVTPQLPTGITQSTRLPARMQRLSERGARSHELRCKMQTAFELLQEQIDDEIVSFLREGPARDADAWLRSAEAFTERQLERLDATVAELLETPLPVPSLEGKQ